MKKIEQSTSTRYEMIVLPEVRSYLKERMNENIRTSGTR